MNYYEHHIGDYDKNTAHLTACEDGIYSRMIRRYYDKEMPLPADVEQVKRLMRARTKEEKQAVVNVLAEFFILEDDGWHQKVCDQVLEKFQAGEPERKAKRANEENRLKRHRADRTKLFKIITDAGEHVPFNTGVAELREIAKRLDCPKRDTWSTTPETQDATGPATGPATPATATQSPAPSPHPPVPISQSPISNLQNPLAIVVGAANAASPRGSRLPADWVLPKNWGEEALSEHPAWTAETVRFEAAKFRDHWVAKTGKDATKLDWFATWRNWCRNARPRPLGGSRGPMSDADRDAANAQSTAAAAKLLGFDKDQTEEVAHAPE